MPIRGRSRHRSTLARRECDSNAQRTRSIGRIGPASSATPRPLRSWSGCVGEESYGQNTLHLVLGVAYLRKMLENAGVVRYLSQHHADVLGEFQKLVESPDLKSAT